LSLSVEVASGCTSEAFKSILRNSQDSRSSLKTAGKGDDGQHLSHMSRYVGNIFPTSVPYPSTSFQHLSHIHPHLSNIYPISIHIFPTSVPYPSTSFQHLSHIHPHLSNIYPTSHTHVPLHPTCPAPCTLTCNGVYSRAYTSQPYMYLVVMRKRCIS